LAVESLEIRLIAADNVFGCWSSPLTAHWADDSYEEGKFSW